MKITDLPKYIIDICDSNDLAIDVKKCHFFNRLLKSKVYYESEHYARNKKSNSSCIQFEHNNAIQMGFIKTFFRVCKCSCIFSCEECKTYAIVSECTTARAFKCDLDQDYIPTVYSCTKRENLLLVNVSDIVNVCYYLSVDDKSYSVTLTNNYRAER